ncbi:MAG: ribbon-helix-helix protein, CopG family [Bacillota bacterium]|nr:ribbon-helix-helix protein, CopG family [Bacillota bacterium]
MDLRARMPKAIMSISVFLFFILEVLALPASKRIIITVPENLLSEVDSFTVMESKNRSEIVREAIKFYLGERKKELMKEQMKKGYLEMAAINLQIATEQLELEDEGHDKCEEKLLE